MSILRALLSGLLALLLLAPRGAAQASPAEPASPAPSPPSPAAASQPSAAPPEAAPADTFYAAMQVRVAEVEVVVTDRDGRRVTGLGPSDFVLFEDGKPVTISGFLAVGSEDVTPESAPATAADVSSQAVSAAPDDDAIAAATTTLSPPPGLVLAVLVDNQSLTPAARDRLLLALREQLATGMRPADRVVVAAQDRPGELRIVFGPAAGGDAAVAALDAATKGQPAGATAVATVRRLLGELDLSANPNIDMSGGSKSAEASMELAESEARRLHQDILETGRAIERQARATAVAANELVAALAAVPGRKSLLLVSGGLPLRPAEALLSAWRNKYGEQDRQWHIDSRSDDRDSDLAPALAALAAAANANHVTIYALAAPEAPAAASAERATMGLWTSLEETTEVSNVREAFERLTEPTGGLASFDVGPPEKFFGELRADVDRYYSLAYSPAERAKDENRKVRVEVRRPGLTVRYRNALRDRTTRELMIERTRAALLFGWQDNPLDVGIELGPTSAGERQGVVTLPVTVTMPLSVVALVPQGGFHEGRLTVYIATGEGPGRTSHVTEVAVPVRVPNDRLVATLSQRLGYRAKLGVRPTKQRLAVSVRDELGNVEATAVVEVDPSVEGEPAALPSPGGDTR